MYCAFNGDKKFRAFDYTNGDFAIKKIYCTLIVDSEENRAKLQHLADINRDVKLVVQLRDPKTNQVKFQTN